MKMTIPATLIYLLVPGILCTLSPQAVARQADSAFGWPDGNRAALSLSFDDARPSQVDVGTALLDRHGVQATFFVVPGAVEQRLEGWKQAVTSGHEIGNHSLNHPCTGNFSWSRDNALEDYTPDLMRQELLAANERIEALLGVMPITFAYPCGQTFVGRGTKTRSYVPIVAKHFMVGRTWLNEVPNDPTFFDPAQVTGIEMDGKNFDELIPLLNTARDQGQWVVLAGHEMGTSGPQTTRLDMLESLIKYAKDPANQLWLAPVGTVASYVLQQRQMD